MGVWVLQAYRNVLMRLYYVVLACLLALGTPSMSAPSETLGIGRLFTNDYFGDGRDRWQSGSYVISPVRGPVGWSGGVQPFGAVREYRFRSAVMASNGRGVSPGDRPYVGVLSMGVHSHFGVGRTRAALGLDLIAIGPQTGISVFQRRAHEILDMPKVRFMDQQLENDLLFGVTAEVAEIVPLTKKVTARPFAEVQLGPEDMVRVGVDVLVGATLDQEVMIRDVSTGHLYRGTNTARAPGVSYLFGSDVAGVTDSLYLSRGVGVHAKNTRGRVRAGVHWQSTASANVFYGLTYLTPEFEGQREGQVTGSVTLNFNF